MNIRLIDTLVATMSIAKDPRLEQLLNGLVYELFFPEDLHARNLRLFDACDRAGLGRFATNDGDALKDEADVWASEYLIPGGDIRVMLSDLQSLDVVRIIESTE